MKNKPSLAFQSPLWAHRDEIRRWRLERMTWRAISEKLKADYDIDLTLQAVRTFFKKASVRKEMPLGFGPDPQQPQPTPAQPAAEVQRHNKELKGSEAYEKGLAEKITNAPKPKLKIID